MDFDVRRVDSVKIQIKDSENGQEVVSNYIDNDIQLTRPEKYDYDKGESVFDVMAIDDTNWSFEKVKGKNTSKKKQYLKVTPERDDDYLVELARTHNESHVRIAACRKINDTKVLLGIIENDSDLEVKKVCLKRLEELCIK